MQHIVSKEQLKDLHIGSMLIQQPENESFLPDTPVTDSQKYSGFLVSGCTPIGWEDVEFELNVADSSGSAGTEAVEPGGNGKPETASVINILGSELISGRQWWVK